jgi:hypothetical protein
MCYIGYHHKSHQPNNFTMVHLLIYALIYYNVFICIIFYGIIKYLQTMVEHFLVYMNLLINLVEIPCMELRCNLTDNSRSYGASASTLPSKPHHRKFHLDTLFRRNVTLIQTQYMCIRTHKFVVCFVMLICASCAKCVIICCN